MNAVFFIGIFVGFKVIVVIYLLMHQITLEESKEADTTTRKATHRVSRGIGSKVPSISCRSLPFSLPMAYVTIGATDCLLSYCRDTL